MNVRKFIVEKWNNLHELKINTRVLFGCNAGYGVASGEEF